MYRYVHVSSVVTGDYKLAGGANPSAGAPVTGVGGRTSRGGRIFLGNRCSNVCVFMLFDRSPQLLFDPKFCYKLQNCQVLSI